MTIQEAIDVLNTRGEHGNLTGYAAWQTEALDMAVRSLEARHHHLWYTSIS